MVAVQGGLLVCRQSPIQVIAGSDVEQCCRHAAVFFQYLEGHSGQI